MEEIVNALTRRWKNLSPLHRAALTGVGVAAFVVTGGGLAYVVATSEALVVILGPVVIATGSAADVIARRV
jgi:hypothetical protein